MTNEKYREYIAQMCRHIDNERDLKQIYTIVHRKFIKNATMQEEDNERKN